MPIISTIAFVGCAIASVTHTQAQPRRREVVVNGTRVKTIDIHAHCIVPSAAALIT